MKHKILAYLLSFFSEDNGSGSSSRLLAATGVLSTIVWVSYVVFTKGSLPDLSGASLFMSASFSGYAVNQAKDAFRKKDETHDDKKDEQK